MAIRVVRLGERRARGEGLRLGTVRRPPRGLKKAAIAQRGYYDVWLPLLAPSAQAVRFARERPWTAARWAQYARRYRREMAQPGPRQAIELLARLSHRAHFSVGCYCEDERRCHRSVLRALLKESGAWMR
ncbi:MAG TPA: DUF488 family protein [Burkholderiales bacterium]|nr:DUF488 family protein [Burkholderiales bacterium]